MPVYIVRIFKSWSARDPERRWSNSYEITSGALFPDGLNATVDALVAAEKYLHGTQVQFLSATVSTWNQDSTPYNPSTFYTRELTGTGTGAPGASQFLDSNVCFLAKFGTTLGRSGRRFYRGCLLESDVETQGDGRFTLSNGSPFLQGGANFVAFRTALLPLIADGSSSDKISLVSGAGSVVAFNRTVTTLTSGGVVINKRNHRYFDRAPSA